MYQTTKQSYSTQTGTNPSQTVPSPKKLFPCSSSCPGRKNTNRQNQSQVCNSPGKLCVHAQELPYIAGTRGCRPHANIQAMISLAPADMSDGKCQVTTILVPCMAGLSVISTLNCLKFSWVGLISSSASHSPPTWTLSYSCNFGPV